MLILTRDGTGKDYVKMMFEKLQGKNNDETQEIFEHLGKIFKKFGIPRTLEAYKRDFRKFEIDKELVEVKKPVKKKTYRKRIIRKQ